MSWFNDDYKRRIPITVDGSSYTGSAAQVEIEVPSDWDDFWDNIQENGYDIVVTDKSGDNILDFQKVYTYSTRSLLIKVNQISTTEEESMHVIYLYWDYPDESTLHETPVSIVSALDGEIYLGAPFGNIVNANNRSNLSTVPTTIFQKDPDEKLDIWFPYAQLLATRGLPYNERLNFKGLQSVKIEALDSSGVNQTSLFALEETRVINNWIRIRVKSGSSDTDYVIRLIMTNTDLEVFILTTLLQVRKLLPS